MSKESEAKTFKPGGKTRTREPLTPPAQHDSLDPQTALALQRRAGNRAVTELLQPNTSPPAEPFLQRKPANGAGEGALEQQADRVETAVAREAAAGKALLVEDDVQSLQPGQMHKSEFLNALKTSVCTAADQELKGTMWSTMGCPYVERWVNVYQGKDSAAVERALQKYAPETRSVTSAEQYIPLVTKKVRKGVAVWKKTGEITDVPPEFAEGGMPGATFEGLVSMGLGALGGLVGKAARAIGGAISGAARAIGSGIASLGRALFKAQPGGAREGGDAAGIQAQLQGGHPLEAEVRGRMETAFGRDFSSVRVHADAGAAHLSNRLNARAFTVGQDVAFGAGEYKPGTLIGDALIAHELAHVVQQGDGKTQGAQTKGTAYDALEEDADVAAVGAVVSGWQGAHGALRDVGRQAMPRMRSGLQLQRCSSKPKYPVLDVSGLPEGPIREATAELSQSDAEVDRNTARQLVNGNIKAHYFEDLAQPADVETRLRGYGLDPAIYTIYFKPGTTQEMIVQKNYIGTQNGTDIIGKRSLSVNRWKTLLVHETNHALNPTDLSDPVKRYKSEFRAYWVAEFSRIANLDERARQVKEHVLHDYVAIKNAYDSDPAVKAAIDAITRPEGDVTNVTGLNPPATTTATPPTPTPAPAPAPTK